MDHPFLTKRHAMADARHKLSLAADVQTLLHMSKEDHACLMAHRLPEVKNEAVRTVLERHAGTVGMVWERLVGLSGSKEWMQFLQHGAPKPSVLAIDALVKTLSADRDAAVAIEHDDGASSYSDYSDSRSVSSSDSDGDDDDDDDDSSKTRP